jgi:nitrite reductase/ring-hydroxylating ferredoxin subunit
MDCDDKTCVSNAKPVVLSGKSPKIFTGRPIKAISGNRIRVKTSDGDVFEADRFCPHKKVDLATWGQVLGRTVICTKHNWNFSMDGSMSTKGRTLNPCKVNDW